MATEGIKRNIAAILSADVVGYSRLMEADEETTIRTIQSYRKTVFSLIERRNGRVIDAPGDNLLSEFGSVVMQEHQDFVNPFLQFFSGKSSPVPIRVGFFEAPHVRAYPSQQ